MKPLSFILGVTVYFGIVSEVALSLGLTTSSLNNPEVPVIIQDPNFLETLKNIWNTVANNMGSFIQIITFTTELPDIINTIFFIPPSAVALFMLLSWVRGTG